MAKRNTRASARKAKLLRQEQRDIDSSSNGLALDPQQPMTTSTQQGSYASSPPDNNSQDDRTPSTVPKCYLLDIAGELRNRIYREVIVSPQDIPVTFTGFHADGIALLKTSKQIRSEALSIFFSENTFNIEIRDYNPDVMIQFNVLLKQSGIKPQKTEKRLNETRLNPCWSNLLRWIQAAYQGSVDIDLGNSDWLRQNKDCRLDVHIFAAMFNSMDELRLQNVPWAVVEAVVGKMRTNLITYDERWAED